MISNCEVDILMNSGSEWRTGRLPRAAVIRQCLVTAALGSHPVLHSELPKYNALMHAFPYRTQMILYRIPGFRQLTLGTPNSLNN